MLISIYYVWINFFLNWRKNANTDKLDQKEDVCYFATYSDVSKNWYKWARHVMNIMNALFHVKVHVRIYMYVLF